MPSGWQAKLNTGSVLLLDAPALSVTGTSHDHHPRPTPALCTPSPRPTTARCCAVMSCAPLTLPQKSYERTNPSCDPVRRYERQVVDAMACTAEGSGIPTMASMVKDDGGSS